MTNVVSLCDYRNNRHRSVPKCEDYTQEISLLFEGCLDLTDKLHVLTVKMSEESDKYIVVPSDIVSFNEQCMHHIARIHSEELDDGYNSVAEFVADLILFEQELNNNDVLHQHILDRHHSRLRIVR